MGRPFRIAQAFCIVAPALLATSVVGARAGDWDALHVSAESPPGWAPGTEQIKRARETFEQFNAALDGGDYAHVYAMTLNPELYPAESKFILEERQNSESLGGLIQRQIVNVTWTKDPKDAVSLGIYVAVDIAARYTNADRFCGYLILFQSDEQADFKVMRRHSVVMLNADAARISKEESDRLWAVNSRLCPNYNPDVDL